MRYVGSKSRIASLIIDTVELFSNDRTVWIEPFVGGANLIDKVSNKYQKFGYDNNEYLIEMFKAIQNGWIPPSKLLERTYKYIRDNKIKCKKHLVGFTGICCSFGAKWFGGYARAINRNYCLESRNHLLSQKEKIKNVTFNYCSYNDIKISNPNKTILYCDPPYKNSIGYNNEIFDTDAFWKWAEKMANNGCLVFVSEYTAPVHWESLWDIELVSSLDLNTGNKKSFEKLFILR